ncbi:MAG: DedA family protein [Campylobacteraceae bacterium]
MIHSIITWIVDTILAWGYLGIFVLMLLESTCFVPIPSEIVMIPAGYLVHEGQMNIFAVLFCGTAGSLAGASLNYFLAYKFGRTLLLKFGKYFFFKPEHLEKVEAFFNKHGEISTFNGRLILGVRHYISLPAGLAKMHFGKFALYTVLGSFIWMLTLTLVGYFIGQNQELAKEYATQFVILAIFVVIIISSIYIFYNKKKSRKRVD